MFRDRRQDRREDCRGGTGAMHYRMRQKLVSIGDDYWIENDQGERVFKVDGGKALRVRKTLIFEDSHGSELLKIQERVARVRGHVAWRAGLLTERERKLLRHEPGLLSNGEVAIEMSNYDPHRKGAPQEHLPQAGGCPGGG